MAEIQYSFSLKYTNGKQTNITDSGNICASQSEKKFISTVQTIGFTAHEALELGDLSDAGISTLCNLDTANDVSIGSDIPCTIAAATGSIVITDYTMLSGDVVTIDGITLTEGVDWTASTDNGTTAASLEASISAVTSVTSSVLSSAITITAASTGIAGNDITMTYTDNSSVGLTLSGATLTGGSDGFVTFIKLKPQEQFIVRLATTNLYALADAADVDLQFTIYSD